MENWEEDKQWKAQEEMKRREEVERECPAILEDEEFEHQESKHLNANSNLNPKEVKI